MNSFCSATCASAPYTVSIDCDGVCAAEDNVGVICNRTNGAIIDNPCGAGGNGSGGSKPRPAEPCFQCGSEYYCGCIFYA